MNIIEKMLIEIDKAIDENESYGDVEESCGMGTISTIVHDHLSGNVFVDPRIDKDKPLSCENCACCKYILYSKTDMCMVTGNRTGCERPNWCPAYIVETDGDKE